MAKQFPEGEAQSLISAFFSLQSYHLLSVILLGYLFYRLEVDWERIWLVGRINSDKYIRTNLVRSKFPYFLDSNSEVYTP